MASLRAFASSASPAYAEDPVEATSACGADCVWAAARSALRSSSRAIWYMSLERAGSQLIGESSLNMASISAHASISSRASTAREMTGTPAGAPPRAKRFPRGAALFVIVCAESARVEEPSYKEANRAASASSSATRSACRSIRWPVRASMPTPATIPAANGRASARTASFTPSNGNVAA